VLKIRKLFRFIVIYGFRRTFIKTLGRLRLGIPAWVIINPMSVFSSKYKIGVIGCGQFSFSTIAFFLIKNGHRKFSTCFDVNIDAAISFAKVYGGNVAETYQEVINNSDIIYIASNHASHTPYTLEALKAGKVVYCEKPVSVSRKQLKALSNVVMKSRQGVFFAGYNRPHSPVVRHVTRDYQEHLRNNPISLDCFIIGHSISSDHWYRHPDEGTRVCGNLGHWIDLFIHLVSFREKEISNYCLSIVSSDPQSPDDNCILTLTTDQKDIFSIFISSRAEPFEGIHETVNLQCSDLHLKINDFRSYELRVGHNYQKKTAWPKNVGHERAILQPFRTEHRSPKEYILSSLLMINFMEMMQKGEATRQVKNEELCALL